MYIILSFVVLLHVSLMTQAVELPRIQSAAANTKRALNDLANVLGSAVNSLRPRNSCPPVWSEISTTLTEQFLANGQCTDAARAAIRAAFHDWFVSIHSSTSFRRDSHSIKFQWCLRRFPDPCRRMLKLGKYRPRSSLRQSSNPRPGKERRRC
jgi:predicted secreted protein